jgi:hypothetical protein
MREKQSAYVAASEPVVLQQYLGIVLRSVRYSIYRYLNYQVVVRCSSSSTVTIRH